MSRIGSRLNQKFLEDRNKYVGSRLNQKFLEDRNKNVGSRLNQKFLEDKEKLGSGFGSSSSLPIIFLIFAIIAVIIKLRMRKK